MSELAPERLEELRREAAKDQSGELFRLLIDQLRHIAGEYQRIEADRAALLAHIDAQDALIAQLRQEAEYAAQFECPKCGVVSPNFVTTKKTCLGCGESLIRSPHPTLKRLNDEIRRLRQEIGQLQLERKKLEAAIRADDAFLEMLSMHSKNLDSFCCYIDPCDQVMEAWRETNAKREKAIALLNNKKGGDGGS